LQRGEYSASQVLTAYAWKAMEVQTRLNCVCEFVIESFEEAAALDERYGNGVEKKPPLFGLPFSVKSNFFVREMLFLIN
jgi:fatty acid amide hydrolase